MPTIDCNFIKEIYWQNAQYAPLELANDILIWRVPASLSGEDLYVNHNSILDEDEIQKAHRFHLDKDKQRFIASRIVLKSLLANYLGVYPSQVRIALGDNKKPYVIHEGEMKLEFNLAHAGEWILIAISGRPIGVDVEKIDELFEFQDIMDFSFKPEEIQFVRDAEISRRQFYTLWTRKEAMLKATAKGLDDDLRAVPALDGTHTVGPSISGTEARWNITSFLVDENHPGSVAYPTHKSHILFFHIDSF